MATPSREIGRVTGRRAGPTLVAVGGVHGNERGGVLAARRVLAALREDEVRGAFVALAGNLGALEARARYVSKDLNRLWTDARVDALRATPAGEGEGDAEDREQRALHDAIAAALGRARGDAYLVDLHTTSARGVPFVIFGDTLRQRRFVGELPLPLILGLEEQLDGTLAGYWTRRGCATFSVEGGQHDEPASVDNLEASLWLALESAGVLARNARPEVVRSRALLDERRGNLPHVMEVLSRHAITPDDAFVMAPGFNNLDFARAGQLLARDRRGEVRAPGDGVVILPLYQGKGDDGFFWGRAVGSARMRVGEALRELHLDRVLERLPGVRRDPAHADRFLVDTRAARLYPLGVFRLFGYRRVGRRGALLTLARQPG